MKRFKFFVLLQFLLCLTMPTIDCSQAKKKGKRGRHCKICGKWRTNPTRHERSCRKKRAFKIKMLEDLLEKHKIKKNNLSSQKPLNTNSLICRIKKKEKKKLMENPSPSHVQPGGYKSPSREIPMQPTPQKQESLILCPQYKLDKNGEIEDINEFLAKFIEMHTPGTAKLVEQAQQQQQQQQPIQSTKPVDFGMVVKDLLALNKRPECTAKSLVEKYKVIQSESSIE